MNVLLRNSHLYIHLILTYPNHKQFFKIAFEIILLIFNHCPSTSDIILFTWGIRKKRQM